ncbi:MULTISPECIES: beta-glucosidase family protein [Novosphingobium]|uniref:beta-glucosidase family protein n=1 Tax=Novosphingobium TaxID=165696 RepID=UPI001CD50718|nr:glycoside hydrolase family 3 C-terminal domain-containing protein [Novosphingobium percolationis]MCH7627242.1 glycoside hydrolase family 3 C-terminal domain-containing protein [Pseudomonadota bacterium]
MTISRILASGVAAVALAHGAAQAQQAPVIDMKAAEARAAATVKQMTPDEKVVLTLGVMPLPGFPGAPPPADAVPGAGYVPGIARLGVPALRETDASLGVSWVMGLRKDGATALPSGLAQAASWNPDVLYRGGATIGAEARAKGFNVLLAGGVNLMRDPRNGRTFEYLAEDPLLSGELVGAAIRGVQSNHIISTIKHFALNGQETGRKYVDVKIAEPAARESDLLAFQIGIERGQPGSAMCAYNRVLGHQACDSDWLLNKVLKGSWGWKGFVMSDWGAVPGVSAALNGLDQQSGVQLDPAPFFGDALKAKAASDPVYAARLDDMNKRILTAIYAAGVDKNPAQPGGAIDFAKGAAVAEDAAKQGIVLLRNTGNLLPLAKTAKSIAVIGGYADTGVLSGAGSSQVHSEGGPAAVRSLGGDGPFAALMSQQYHRSVPLKAIKAMAPNAVVTFRDGRYITDAVEKARQAEVAIVFANEWRMEGADQPDLSLPDGQDALIAAVAAANPNTIVVLQTGGPVLMPWLDKVGAVVEAWYPGARGGEAIASVLFGDTNPGGRLPVTFPASVDQLPRPKLDGSDWVEPNFAGDPAPGKDQLHADYDIEGSDVGYRWFAKKGQKALFPFGYGLSYTTFAGSGLKVAGLKAGFTLTNTGKVAGDDVGQVYLVGRNGQKLQRLVGFQRVTLAPGTSQKVNVTIDPRLLADWKDGGWTMPAGSYSFALGRDAETLSAPVSVKLSGKTWKD